MPATIKVHFVCHNIERSWLRLIVACEKFKKTLPPNIFGGNVFLNFSVSGASTQPDPFNALHFKQFVNCLRHCRAGNSDSL